MRPSIRPRVVRHVSIDGGQPYADFRAAYETAVPAFDRLEAVGVVRSGAGWSGITRCPTSRRAAAWSTSSPSVGAYRALAANSGSSLTRVLVQPMLAGGVEVRIGVVQEPMFGPLVVFALGGAATEALGHHAARLTPLTDADANELIHAAHVVPLLSGHPGTPPVDTGALANALSRVSRLADDLPEVAELDLSPVFAGPDGICAVDVRVRVSPAEPRDPFLRRLR